MDFSFYLEASMKISKLQIDLNALKFNINQIKNRLSAKTEIIAMLKADAYGNGANKLIDTLIANGINYIAVANALEGENIREYNKEINIVVLNQPTFEQIEYIIKNNLICGVSGEEFVRELNKCAESNNVISKVHLEIDTGAGRNGILPSQLDDILNLFNEEKNVELEGVYTHFTCADSDDEFTLSQIEMFESVIEKVRSYGINPIVHCANSATIINYPQAHYDMVRPGILLYGYYPDESVKGGIEVKPVEKWISEISYLKKVPKGSAISYNKTFITDRESIIAVIPVGYADGYKRSFSNKADVLVKGKRARVVGRVCMDMIMVDVTDIEDVKVGDEVCLFDNKEITVDELAKIANTINYEIIVGIGKRVEREYI